MRRKLRAVTEVPEVSTPANSHEEFLSLRLLDVQQTLQFLGNPSKSKFYEDVAKGTLPRPIKLSDESRASYWVESELREVIVARMAARSRLGGAS